eukprot:5686499-Prymnesium_polylepis.1
MAASAAAKRATSSIRDLIRWGEAGVSGSGFLQRAQRGRPARTCLRRSQSSKAVVWASELEIAQLAATHVPYEFSPEIWRDFGIEEEEEEEEGGGRRPSCAL